MPYECEQCSNEVTGSGSQDLSQVCFPKIHVSLQRAETRFQNIPGQFFF